MDIEIINLGIFELKKHHLLMYLAIFILSSWTFINFQKQSKLHEQQAEFEKYKISETAKLQQGSLIFKDRELALDATKVQVAVMQGNIAAMEAQASAKLRMADEKELSVLNREKKVDEVLVAISPSVQRILEENNIKRLMEEFSLLGVSLRNPPLCTDVLAVGRYARAKSILSQISARARAADLYDKYISFIVTNQSIIKHDCMG